MVEKESSDHDMRTLESVKKKRGYVLPYHELFWCINPDLLAKYDAFYERLTLKANHLDNKTKELVWLGILISVFEEAGTIHLKRATEAGVTDEEIRDVIKLTQVARGFEVVRFVGDKWKEHLPAIDPLRTYGDLIESVTERVSISRKVCELVFIGIYCAIPIPEALKYHLLRANKCGVRDEEIAEAMSFIFIPRGGNVLIEAAQVLKDIVQSGQFKPNSAFRHWLDAAS